MARLRCRQPRPALVAVSAGRASPAPAGAALSPLGSCGDSGQRRPGPPLSPLLRRPPPASPRPRRPPRTPPARHPPGPRRPRRRPHRPPPARRHGPAMGRRDHSSLRRPRPAPATRHSRPALRRGHSPLGSLPRAAQRPSRLTSRRHALRLRSSRLTGSSSQPRTSPSVLTGTHYAWLALGILVLAVYGSLIPFHFQPRPLNEAFAAFRHIAFHDPTDLHARGDWIVSVALFLALSYLFMAALCVDRRGRGNLAAAAAVLLVCAALSVAIEFAQLYFPPRTVSLNDIAVETLGAAAGTFLWLIAGQRI